MNNGATIPHAPARATIIDTVVAEWIGLTPHGLHVLHPDDFGTPRDFRWDGAHCLYTAEGLRRLRLVLLAGGQGPAGARLAPLIERLEGEDASRSPWFRQTQYA